MIGSILLVSIVIQEVANFKCKIQCNPRGFASFGAGLEIWRKIRYNRHEPVRRVPVARDYVID